MADSENRRREQIIAEAVIAAQTILAQEPSVRAEYPALADRIDRAYLLLAGETKPEKQRRRVSLASEVLFVGREPTVSLDEVIGELGRNADTVDPMLGVILDDALIYLRRFRGLADQFVEDGKTIDALREELRDR